MDFHQSRGNGTFDFGFIDTNKYHGSIAYSSVVADNGGEWVFPISGFAVGSTFIKNSFNVLLDTGNPDGLSFPRWAVDRYFAQIPNTTWQETSSTYSFPCGQKMNFPDIVFGVGDSFKAVIPGGVMGLYWFDQKKNLCVGAMRSVKNGEKAGWGKLIIQNLYVVFDYGNKRVGFANKST